MPPRATATGHDDHRTRRRRAATIQRIEKSDHPITGYGSTIVRIQAAFEQAGVLFIDDDEIAGIGLRLAKKKRKRQIT